MSERAIRWSDNDRYFGPFTYAHERRYHRWGVMLGSGDGDDYPGARLRLHLGPHTLILALPQAVLRPWREKVYPKWDEATVARLGRDWYWNQDAREYGFSIAEGSLHVYFGRQSHDSRTDRNNCYFLPWRQWRHVRHSLYGLEGEWFVDLPQRKRGPYNPHHWAVETAIQDACPTVIFAFKDYDGEALTATTKIEERKWLFGTGAFKWLSLFCKPKVRRDLDIRFSGETGRRKGSWKGGTIGHSIDMLFGELHEAAFRRYCEQNNMTFAGQVQATPTTTPRGESV